MQHRHDYVELEPPPSPSSALLAIRAAAGAVDDASIGAAAVVPILLGKTGQQAPVVGGAAQVEVHEVRGRGRGGHARFLARSCKRMLQVTQKLGDEVYA